MDDNPSISPIEYSREGGISAAQTLGVSDCCNLLTLMLIFFVELLWSSGD